MRNFCFDKEFKYTKVLGLYKGFICFTRKFVLNNIPFKLKNVFVK